VNKSEKKAAIKETFYLILKHPVLFLPKLLIAILYGVSTLLTVDYAKQLVALTSVPKSQIVMSDFANLFMFAGVLMIAVIVIYFIDIFFSGLYPILVDQARKGKVSFRKAFHEIKPRLVTLFVSAIITWVIITIVSFLESFLLQALGFDYLGIIVVLVITFAFIFLLYFLYPIIALNKKSIFSSFKETFVSSLENKRTVFVYSLIPFSVSLFKLGIAYFSDQSFFMIVFWLLVLVTAIVYTIHAVVNQVLYSKVTHSEK
jgi:hypothetical protein